MQSTIEGPPGSPEQLITLEATRTAGRSRAARSVAAVASARTAGGSRATRSVAALGPSRTAGGKRRFKECGGSRICPHGEKRRCKECGRAPKLVDEKKGMLDPTFENFSRQSWSDCRSGTAQPRKLLPYEWVGGSVVMLAPRLVDLRAGVALPEARGTSMLLPSKHHSSDFNKTNSRRGRHVMRSNIKIPFLGSTQ